MSFNMDDLFSDAKRYVGIVGEKTGSAVEYSKKQVSSVQLRVQFREKLTELGRLCYDMHDCYQRNSLLLCYDTDCCYCIYCCYYRHQKNCYICR